MPCNRTHNKTVELKVENLAQTTFRLSPVSLLSLQAGLNGQQYQRPSLLNIKVGLKAAEQSLTKFIAMLFINLATT
jgi:hypothetical protein